MAGNEAAFKGITIGTYDNENYDLSNGLAKYLKGNITIFCIGTDRSTGDSFAPLVGAMLKEKGYENVIGTLDDPVHAQNLEQRIKEIPSGNKVLAIDASLGRERNIGKLILNSGAVYAGRGVGKELPPVGDFHIKGIVNISSMDNMINHSILSSTRLSTVIKMAKCCAYSIESALPLDTSLQAAK